jgi:glycerol-3-phosphate dehydrogenase (NAD(P)+)
MAVVTVVGAGMMGSAFCVPLADRGHEVRLVGTPLDDALVDGYREGKPHPRMGVPLPASIRHYRSTELREAAEGADVLGIGVSSAGVSWVASAIGPFVRPRMPVIMITKGLGWDGERLSVLPDVLASLLPDAVRDAVFPVAVGGPCIAGELVRRVPTCVVFAGRDSETNRRLAELARTAYYHPATSTDVVGVEVCAALKNAFAMGAAFGQGLHEKAGGVPGSVAMHNHEAAVFAQSIREMAKIVVALGGGVDAALGLPGAGDLTVTCNGGRTGRFGKLLGAGNTLPEAIAKMDGATLECLEILGVMRAALPGLEAQGLLKSADLPLLAHLCEVALDGKPVDVPFSAMFGA